jgi:hypothetical protein
MLYQWTWLVGYSCLVLVLVLVLAQVQMVPTQRACMTARGAAVNHSCAHNATMSGSTHSSATDVEEGSSNDAPQVEALFLIRFDKKVGYGIARVGLWRRPC